MSTAARALAAVVYLPIDGLIASLEDALAEIAEIETRRGAAGEWPGASASQHAASLEQRQRLRDAKDYLIHARRLVYEYAKGPTA